MIFVQISDLHVQAPPGATPNPRFDEAAALLAAVAQINAMTPQPAFVVATGDLVTNMSEREYAALAEILGTLKAPLRLVPGNHDARDPLRAAFPAHDIWPAEGFLHYAEDWGPLRLVAIDTLKAGSHGGALCAARRAWLAEQLGAAPDRPTVIAMHHPPFATGLPNFDRLGFEGGAELAALLARHPQVERVLCGHVHRPISVRFGGTLASIGPSTAYAYALELHDPSLFQATEEPVGFQVHHWEGSRLVSHVVPVGPPVPRG